MRSCLMQLSPDQDGVTQSDIGAFDTGQGDRQRFAQRPFFEGHVVGESVKPVLGVGVVACESAVVGWGGEEDDAGACRGRVGLVANGLSEHRLPVISFT